MAIVNGKRLYNSDKLEAVAREDDRAAAEYAWMMAGVNDDWGRFRLSPRRILGKAYDRRPSVNELLVGDWLSLYEKHGLLQIYTSGGTTYAEWTNYMGDPPSQRHFHSCPEPPWSAHKHNKECKFRDDAVPTRRGRPSPTALPTRQGTQTHSDKVPDAVAPGYPSVPAVPSVRSVPSVPADTASDNLAARPGYDRPEPLVDGRRPDLETEWLRLVREIAAIERVNPEDVPPAWEGKRGLNPAMLTPARLLRDLIDLRARRARHEPKAQRPRDEKPPEENALFDRRQELAAEFVAWFRDNPDAGVVMGRPGFLGEAIGKWPGGKDLPAWVRAAVLKIAGELAPADPSRPHTFEPDTRMRAKADHAPLCWCTNRKDHPLHGAA